MVRLSIETLLFFILPFVSIGFLYIKVGLVLARKSRNVSRNRVLTLAFALSWVFWIVCWAPNIMLMVFNNGSGYMDFSDGSNISNSSTSIAFGYDSDYQYSRGFSTTLYKIRQKYYIIWTYIEAFRIPLQLIYSHLNPFIYLIVLKKFQDHHVTIFLAIGRFWFSKRLPGAKNEQQKEGSPICFNYRRLVCILRHLKVPLLTSCILLKFGCLIKAGFYATMFTSSTRMTAGRGASDLSYFENSLTKINFEINALFRHSDTSSQVRPVCGDYHGILSMSYARCYLVVQHNPVALDFAQQRQACADLDFVLCYPKTQTEIRFMWRYVETFLSMPEYFVSSKYEMDYFLNYEYLYDGYFIRRLHDEFLGSQLLHMGFEKSKNDVFTSVDGKFNISSEKQSWLYSWEPYDVDDSALYNQRLFHGPAVCLSNLKNTLYECRFTMRTNISICCKDFFF